MSTVPIDTPTRTPSAELATLADPQVRAAARRAIAGRKTWAEVADTIGVTVDELQRCLGPRRSWWGRGL